MKRSVQCSYKIAPVVIMFCWILKHHTVMHTAAWVYLKITIADAWFERFKLVTCSSRVHFWDLSVKKRTPLAEFSSNLIKLLISTSPFCSVHQCLQIFSLANRIWKMYFRISDATCLPSVVQQGSYRTGNVKFKTFLSSQRPFPNQFTPYLNFSAGYDVIKQQVVFMWHENILKRR